MANKRFAAQRAKEKKLKNYKEQCDKTRWLHFGTIGICVLTLLLFFVNFAEIYNTGMTTNNGIEVSVSGWSFFVAGISGKYTLPDNIYGDLAHPFYTWAGSWCETIGTLMVVIFFVALAVLIVETLTIVLKIHWLTYVSTVLNLTMTILLLIVFITGISMNGSQILPEYCNNNPACSIRTQAIFSFISAIAGTIMSGVIAGMLIKAKIKAR